MSSESASHVPLWAERYLPDFAALQRILERAEHFFLQPVETPSPDVGRVLAGWLQAQGWQVRVLRLEDEAAWMRLAEVLQREEAGERRVVVVLAPYDLDRELMRTALARVNMQRDVIVRRLDCPLLWCGTGVFEQSTWEYAPDFWSIASTPYRIALRDPEQAKRDHRGAMMWWTGAGGEDVAALASAFRGAVEAGGEASELAALGLRLAECQLAQRDPAGAAQVLATIEPMTGVDLAPRWRSLHEDVRATMAGGLGDTSELRRQILEAVSRGAKSTEARLRMALADRLRFLPGIDTQHEALGELYQSREISARAGDNLAVLSVDRRLTDLAGPHPPELLEKMVANAERWLRDSEDSRIRGVAALVLAEAYRQQERREDAERALDAALGRWSIAGDPETYMTLLRRRERLARGARDWPLAYDLESKMIAVAQKTQSPGMELVLRVDRGISSVSMGKPFHACVDALASANAAHSLGADEHGYFGLVIAAIVSASMGLRRIGVVVGLRAVRVYLRLLSPSGGPTGQLDLSWLAGVEELQLAEQIDALKRWVTEVKPTLAEVDAQRLLLEFDQEFAGILEVREAALRAEGIDAMDPQTWGVSESPPEGRGPGASQHGAASPAEG